MTALTESQLLVDLDTQLDILYGSFIQSNDDISSLVAAVSALVTTLDTVLDTLSGNVGTAAGDDLTADLVAMKTVADALP